MTALATLPTPNDGLLMALARAGDSGAFDQLYLRWYKPVFAYHYKFTGSAASAEDRTLETWLRVVRSRHRFDEQRGSFRVWLFSIAVNVRRDQRKLERRWRDLKDSVHLEQGFTGPEIAALMGRSPGAVRTVLMRARTQLQGALDAL